MDLKMPPLLRLCHSLEAAVQGIFLTKAIGRPVLVRRAIAPLTAEAAIFKLRDLRDLRSRRRKNLHDPGHGNLHPGQRSLGGEMGKMAAAVSSVATLATEPGEDAFRKLFRFYRQSRPGTADLGGVIDFSAAQAAHGTGPGAHKVGRGERRAPFQSLASFLGGVSVSSHPVFCYQTDCN